MTSLIRTLLFIVMALANPVLAQQADSPSWWQTANNHVINIMNTGTHDLYLSGYIHHGRGTYSEERIKELNEKDAWGLGIGKTVRNDRMNDESLFILGFNDSHYNLQLMAGYAYLWVWPIARTGFEVSGGLSALLISRQDYFGGFPFPAVLPVAAVGPQKAKLFFSYVPRLSGNKGNGDVLFVFGRISFD